MQFNVPLKPHKKVAYMKDLPDVLLPMFWIEEGVALNATYVKQLKDLFKLMKIVDVVKWVILVASVFGMGVGGFMYMKNSSGMTVTPVQKEQPTKGNSVISLVQNGSGLDGARMRRPSKNEFTRY